MRGSAVNLVVWTVSAEPQQRVTGRGVTIGAGWLDEALPLCGRIVTDRRHSRLRNLRGCSVKERPADDPKRSWDESFPLFVAWVTEHGRLPLKTKYSDVEHRHATWMQYQRRHLGHGTLLPDHQQKLDDAVPGWEGPAEPGVPTPDRYAQLWEARLAELVAWVGEHDRWPTAASADPVESRVGSWLGVQRGRKVSRSRNYEQRCARLTEVLPGWDAEILDRGLVKRQRSRFNKGKW